MREVIFDGASRRLPLLRAGRRSIPTSTHPGDGADHRAIPFFTLIMHLHLPGTTMRRAAGDGQLQRRAIQPSPQPSGGVVGIVDYAESLVVEYKYNPWGKPILL